ncbi:MAG: hypothetical protein AAF636_18655 [Pseudomonadota bacterium]
MSKQDNIQVPGLAGALERAADNRRVEIDVEKYQAYLDDPSLGDAQREELLRALWSIISAFVELGFGVHPTQQACGQVENGLEAGGAPQSDVVGCKNTNLKREFNDGPIQD